MKRLYLMRHGHAPSTQEAGVAKDALRPLSERGRADARRAAAEIARRGGAPRLILHSPLLRAAQTAAEAASELKAALEVFRPLDNTLPAEEAYAAVAERAADAEEVLAVGHQPQVGEIAALLGRALFDMPPAAVVAVEFAPEPRVLWTLGPEPPA